MEEIGVASLLLQSNNVATTYANYHPTVACQILYLCIDGRPQETSLLGVDIETP